MENPNTALLQDLRYGIIYVYGNPKRLDHFRWFATMIEPMMRPLTLEWRESCAIDGTLIVARRFNVANLGKYATVQLHLARQSTTYSLLAAVHVFSDCLEDITDTSEGDVIINEDDYQDRFARPEGRWGHSTESTSMYNYMRNKIGLEEPQDHTQVAPKLDYDAACRQLKKCQQSEAYNESAKIDKYKGSDEDYWGDEEVDNWISEDDWEDEDADTTNDGIAIEEEVEFRKIADERDKALNSIRASILQYITTYHDDPQTLISHLLEGKFIINETNEPGRLLVNGDMKVVLPQYDEMEIKMPAMCRSVYILFLKLRKQGLPGIPYSQMDHYREQLAEIYSLVKPNANEQRMQKTINNLCNPLGNALNETISRINKSISQVVLNKKLAEHYLILGPRGGNRSIALDANLIELPRAVTAS